MSGPIVRIGTTPEFWRNWEKVFGKKTSKEPKGGAKSAKKSGKKKSGKKK